MIDSAHAWRCRLLLVALCALVIAAPAEAARKKSKKHRATPSAASVPADTPGTSGSIVRRSPWLQLGELPNFTEGVWQDARASSHLAADTPAPWKTEQLTATNMATKTGDSDCAGAAGMPTMMQHAAAFEFVYEPGRVIMLLSPANEPAGHGQVRRIYTDGRAHPDLSLLTRSGHSIGHWEKNTLIVDTVAILPDTPLAPGVVANGPVHVVERMHLINTETLVIETSVDAPGALDKQWAYTLTYKRVRDCDGVAASCRGSGITADLAK